MKDEEMAEEYVDKMTRDWSDGEYSFSVEELRQAFLAGLKVGRPQWHKVADGDLPTTVGRRFLVSNRYCTMIGYWNGRTFVSTDEETAEIASPIAWCEIPQFNSED